VLDAWLMAKLTADQRRDLMHVIAGVAPRHWPRRFRRNGGMSRFGDPT